MSSIIKISCKKGVFVYKDSLEEVLKELHYSSKLGVFKNSDGTYSIEISKKIDSDHQSRVYNQLKKKLDEILPKIHQSYAIKVATRDLISKGFEFTKKRLFNNNQELTFEKVEDASLERMILTIYPDLTITVDSFGFMDRNCDNYTKDFQKGFIGNFSKSYKTKEKNPKVKYSPKIETKNQIKLGLK